MASSNSCNQHQLVGRDLVFVVVNVKGLFVISLKLSRSRVRILGKHLILSLLYLII